MCRDQQSCTIWSASWRSGSRSSRLASNCFPSLSWSRRNVDSSATFRRAPQTWKYPGNACSLRWVVHNVYVKACCKWQKWTILNWMCFFDCTEESFSDGETLVVFWLKICWCLFPAFCGIFVHSVTTVLSRFWFKLLFLIGHFLVLNSFLYCCFCSSVICQSTIVLSCLMCFLLHAVIKSANC